MIVTPKEAGDLACPNSIGVTIKVAAGCCAHRCMAWRWHDWRVDGDTFANEGAAVAAAKARGLSLLGLERRGFCGLAGKGTP